VATNFFDVLGARPQLGRTFVPDEERWGKHRVAILSHTLWMSSFGGKASVLGKEVTVDSEPFTIIGVMPAEFSSPHSEVQLWVPMSPRPGMTINRDQRFMRVIARLKPGVTSQRAQIEMETLTHRLEQEYPEDRGVTAYLGRVARSPQPSKNPAFTAWQLPDGLNGIQKRSNGLGEINGELLEADFGTTSSESALDVTSGFPELRTRMASAPPVAPVWPPNVGMLHRPMANGSSQELLSNVSLY